MWVRKRIEITPADLARGLGGCLSSGDRQQLRQQIADVWEANDLVVCLSVRSGFDLLLQSAGWQRGSEVILSGLTIPDMPKIVEANGLKAVGVDIDLKTMQPDARQIQNAINPNTRAIVVAHLLGGVFDISPVLNIARKHNLLIIEDCAQAFVGSEYQGDERADVSMFSFGPIKTNTALGGAMLRVRNKPFREKMERKQDQWKFQSSFSFAKRIGKYAFVKVISSRPFCGGIYRFMKLFGKNHDGIASSMARGFAGPGFFERIRKQPSKSLLKLLHHKLALFDSASTDRRRKLGEHFVQMVGDRVHVLGSQMERQTFWVLPILVGDPRSLVQTMWDAGFDASTHCSLHSITRNQNSTAARILKHIVFLPIHPAMPINEVRRMAEVVLAANPVIPDWIGQNGTGTDHPAKAIVSDSQFAKSPELVGQVAR